jgi:hypothetical protein
MGYSRSVPSGRRNHGKIFIPIDRPNRQSKTQRRLKVVPVQNNAFFRSLFKAVTFQKPVYAASSSNVFRSVSV